MNTRLCGEVVWKLSLLLVVLMSVSLAFGASTLNPLQVFDGASVQADILRNLRLPRIVAAALIGAALAVSGVTVQGIFRNPLAEPALIGVSSGAAFTAALALLVLPAGLLWLDLYIAAAAFVGGVLVSYLIYSYFSYIKVQNTGFLLLIGIAVNALLAAAIGLLNFTADSDQLRQLFFWSMGGFGNLGWSAVITLMIFLIPAGGYLFKQHQALNALLLGDQEAAHLGFNVQRDTRLLLLLVALIVGATVAVAGIIGFVGLVVPHICRRITGANHQQLFPVAALVGAILMVLTDVLSRVVLAPAEIPVGLITALLGAPFFLWLLSTRRAIS